MRCLVILALLLAGVGALLLGAYLLGAQGDHRGILGLLLLSTAGLFLQARWRADYSAENIRLLSERVCRLRTS